MSHRKVNHEIFLEDSAPSYNFPTFELTQAQVEYLRSRLNLNYRLEPVKPVKEEAPEPVVQKPSVKETVPIKKAQPPKTEPSTRTTFNVPRSAPTQNVPQQNQPSKLQLIIPSNLQDRQPPPEEVFGQSTSSATNPPAFKTKAQAPNLTVELSLPPPVSKPKPQMPSDEKTKCLSILQSLKNHVLAGPFLYPVDVKGLNIPEYLKIIKKPMDLSTVEKNLRNDVYFDPKQFEEDVRTIWTNAMTFNVDHSSLYDMAQKLNAYFDTLWRGTEATTAPPLQVRVKEPYDINKYVKKFCKQVNSLMQKGGRFTLIDYQPIKYANYKNQPMTLSEKKALYQNIASLPPAYQKGVWDIVNESIPSEKRNRDMIEFDLETLSIEVSRKLERFVNYHIAQIKKSTSRRERALKKKESLEQGHKMRKTENGEKKIPNFDDASSISSFFTESEDGGEDEVAVS